MLKIENLRKMYGIMTALDDFNMHVPAGALYGFVGPNGAGKTTTIKILTGLIPADSGKILLKGEEITAGLSHNSCLFGYVPDFFGVYDNLKVSEYMELFAGCYGLSGLESRRKSAFLLDQVGLGEKEGHYVDGLSRGMKQRLSLARALIHNPEILVMDEPTSGLDPRTRMEFRDILKELRDQGKTVIISSHVLPELSELCTDIGIIDQGKMILEGSMEEIQSQVHVKNPLIITVFNHLEQAASILRSHPYVESLAIRENQISIIFTGDAQDEALLLQQLIDAGVLVNGFMRERGTLESIFMQITGHEEEVTLLREG